MEAYREVEKCVDFYPFNEIRVRRGVGYGIYLKRAREILNDPRSLN